MLKNVWKVVCLFNLKGLTHLQGGNVPYHLYSAHSSCLFTSLGATRLCSSLFPSVLLLLWLVLGSLTHSVFVPVT